MSKVLLQTWLAKPVSYRTKQRNSSARMEVELKSIHGATAFEDEYIVNGDGIEVNGALDEQVGHCGSVQVGRHGRVETLPLTPSEKA